MGMPEIILFFLLAVVCVYGSVSDIRFGTISNKVLLYFSAAGIAADCIYYLNNRTDLFRVYLINLATVSILAVLLFLFHIWAGGDSKFLITAAILYPAGYCFSYKGFHSTFALVIPFSFAFGFIFLIIIAIILFLREKRKIDIRRFFGSFLLFIKRYAVMFLYTAFANILVSQLVPASFRFRQIVLMSICFCIPWIIQRFPVLKKKAVLAVIFVVDMILMIVWKEYLAILNPSSFLIVFVSACIQILLSDFSYQTIPAAEIRKGMILSLSSSMLMMNSRVRGLPGLSTEDLASRLSENEAESVRRWALTEKGKEHIIIVRKVPFAVFIAIGILFYLVIWLRVT